MIPPRKNVQTLTPYQSARKIGGQGQIWLNANEFALTPSSPDFGVDFGSVDVLSTLNRYPEPQPAELIARYATYANVHPTNVLVTRGGDEGIELIMRSFCEADEAVLYCPPTYGMYGVSCQTLGLSAVTVAQIRHGDGFRLDVCAIGQALTDNPAIKVVFVCNPNNPTGTLVHELEELLELTAGRALLVVDEAYIEFAKTHSLADKIDQHPHLIIVRTLSKAFGLAGLRVGFLLANADIIATLAKVIAPYPIPVPSAALASHALSPQNLHVTCQRIATLNHQKTALAEALRALPCVVQVFDSYANYLLIEFTDGQRIFETLWEQGMILRNQHHAPLLANCIRMTIGTDDENRAVVDFLRTL